MKMSSSPSHTRNIAHAPEATHLPEACDFARARVHFRRGRAERRERRGKVRAFLRFVAAALQRDARGQRVRARVSGCQRRARGLQRARGLRVQPAQHCHLVGPRAHTALANACRAEQRRPHSTKQLPPAAIRGEVPLPAVLLHSAPSSTPTQQSAPGRGASVRPSCALRSGSLAAARVCAAGLAAHFSSMAVPRACRDEIDAFAAPASASSAACCRRCARAAPR
jgi:hypothetical protein